jgi:hypothetical protein
MKLIVIIADEVPVVFLQEPVKHRMVQIELTDEQFQKINLKQVGESGGHYIHETISQCFLQDDSNDHSQNDPA